MGLGSVLRLVSGLFSGRAALDHVAAIARFHRAQMMPGIVDAVKYVEGVVRGFGFEVEVFWFSARDGVRFMSYESGSMWRVKDARVELVEPRRDVLLRFKDCPTMVPIYSPPTPADGVVGEVVYVGLGSREEDYAGKDVSGKVVLAHGSPLLVQKFACKFGASAIMLFGLEKPLDAAIYTRCLRELCNVPIVSLPRSVALRLLREIERGGKVVVKIVIESESFDGEFPVVTARVDGVEDRYLALTAHICHYRPGANDNASGAGTLVEVARVLKNVLSKPRRGVFLAWAPEYTGFAALIEELERRGGVRFYGGINLDMVGEKQEVTGAVLQVVETPYSNPSYIDYLLEEALERLIYTAESFGGVKVPAYRYSPVEYSYGSDHDIFCDPSVNAPAVMVNCWPDKYYHTDKDDIDKVDPKMLWIVGSATTAVAKFLSDADAEDALYIAKLVVERGLKRGLERVWEAYSKAVEDSKWRHVLAARIEVFPRVVSRKLERVTELEPSIEPRVREELSRFQRAWDAAVEGLKELAQWAEPKELSGIRVKRLFRGLVTRALLGTEDYINLRVKSAREFPILTSEAQYMFDGETPLSEVYKVLLAEYGPVITPEKLLEFVRVLERKGLVRVFSSSSAAGTSSS